MIEEYGRRCVRASMESVEQVVSKYFLEFGGFEFAVCPSFERSGLHTSHARDVTYGYFVLKRRCRLVSLLLTSSVQIVQSDKGCGHLVS